MSQTLERREVVFRGRVQGVGFRATMRGLAQSLPVVGWVRNEPDGTVRAQIQGAAIDIEALLGRVEAAMGGHITGRAAHSIHTVGGEAGFVIKR